MLIACLFPSCEKENTDDFSTQVQEFPAEHNHLVHDIRTFKGDTRLGFFQVEESPDNNIYYLASNDIESIDYFEVIVPGEDTNVQLPEQSSSYELGKMNLTGDKLWAESFSFVPSYFIIKGWPILDTSPLIILIGQKAGDIAISIITKEGEVLFDDTYDVEGGYIFTSSIINIPNTDRFVLTGTSLDSGNITPYLAEINIDPTSLEVTRIRETFLYAYDAWPNSIHLLDNSPIAKYVLEIENLPGSGSLIFLNETFEINKNTPIGLDTYNGFRQNKLVVIENGQILVSGVFADIDKEIANGGYFESFAVVSFNLEGEELWRTETSASEKYSDETYSMMLTDDFVYLVGYHSNYCQITKKEGEILGQKCFSNGLLVKYNKIDGSLVNTYTFSKETNPWNKTKLKLALSINDKVYMFGEINEQEQTEGEGWVFYVHEDDL